MPDLDTFGGNRQEKTVLGLHFMAINNYVAAVSSGGSDLYELFFLWVDGDTNRKSDVTAFPWRAVDFFKLVEAMLL